MGIKSGLYPLEKEQLVDGSETCVWKTELFTKANDYWRPGWKYTYHLPPFPTIRLRTLNNESYSISAVAILNRCDEHAADLVGTKVSLDLDGEELASAAVEAKTAPYAWAIVKRKEKKRKEKKRKEKKRKETPSRSRVSSAKTCTFKKSR